MNPDHHAPGSYRSDARKNAAEAAAPACECPTDDYCPRCHPRWHALHAERTKSASTTYPPCGNCGRPSGFDCCDDPSPAATVPLPESDLAGRLLDGSRDLTVGAAGENTEPTDRAVRDMAALGYLVTTCIKLGIEYDEDEADEFTFARAIHRRIRALLATPADTGHTPTEAIPERFIIRNDRGEVVMIRPAWVCPEHPNQCVGETCCCRDLHASTAPASATETEGDWAEHFQEDH